MRMKYGNEWDLPLCHSKTDTAESGPPQAPLFIDDKPEIETTVIDAGLNKIENFYKNIKPGLSERQSKVLFAVKEIQPCTMHAVAKHLHVELNTISGRFGELVEKGFLKIIKKTDDNKSVYTIHFGELTNEQ